MASDTKTATKTYRVTHSDEEWRRILTPEQYAVMRGHGTERPGSCALLHEKRPGTFVCAGCGEPLFAGEVKFESGTGWPSFNTPVEGAVETDTDTSLGMARTEVHCATCGSHLGHVFPDGPPPTGLRYCINGVAMDFRAGVRRARSIEERRVEGSAVGKAEDLDALVPNPVEDEEGRARNHQPRTPMDARSDARAFPRKGSAREASDGAIRVRAAAAPSGKTCSK